MGNTTYQYSNDYGTESQSLLFWNVYYTNLNTSSEFNCVKNTLKCEREHRFNEALAIGKYIALEGLSITLSVLLLVTQVGLVIASLTRCSMCSSC